VTAPAPAGRGPRPQLALTRGEIGLCVWALGLLATNVEEEAGADLLAADLERLVDRLRQLAYDLDAWHAPAELEEAEDPPSGGPPAEQR
jgi:hypothetical protein